MAATHLHLCFRRSSPAVFCGDKGGPGLINDLPKVLLLAEWYKDCVPKEGPSQQSKAGLGAGYTGGSERPVRF